LAAALLACFLLLRITSLWEARALVEIGRIEEPRINGEKGATYLEDPAVIVASTSFLAKTQPDFRLKIEKVNGADLLQFKVRATSARLAKELLGDAIRQLQNRHLILFRERVQVLQNELQNLEAESSQVNLLKGFVDRTIKAPKSDQDIILAAIAMQNELRASRELERYKNELKDRLDPAKTFTTRMIGNISVSAGPVYPATKLIVAVTFALAFMLTFLAVYFLELVQYLLRDRQSKNK
jgi:hypothetical protein